ncbi:DUF2000 family protein [Cellulosimicrobium cellulans]|uniref:DUF2000 family protein n=1 Tax=Cellulosimicrobium cellulans TaxID=1710 RepID=UPI001EDB625A
MQETYKTRPRGRANTGGVNQDNTLTPPAYDAPPTLDAVPDAVPDAVRDAAPVRFDTKVAVVLRDDLLPWQELNVTAFLMSGISTSAPDLVGEAYRDADGTRVPADAASARRRPLGLGRRALGGADARARAGDPARRVHA